MLATASPTLAHLVQEAAPLPCHRPLDTPTFRGAADYHSPLTPKGILHSVTVPVGAVGTPGLDPLASRSVSQYLSFKSGVYVEF